jgi:uncharacterized protein YccT (UPF0319 family)
MKLKITLTDGTTNIIDVPNSILGYMKPNANLKSVELVKDEKTYNVFIVNSFGKEITLAENISEENLDYWLTDFFKKREIKIKIIKT